MLIEQQIEKQAVQKIEAILSQGNFGSFQVYGTLQPETLKAVEGDADIVVVVKIQPRAYQTATTPICQIEGTVSLVVRADVDYNGHTYLDVCDSMMTQFETWQKCLDDAHEDFAVEGRFQVAGFQLGSG